MHAELMPMDAELAALGRCWHCKQSFEHDEFYIQLGMGTAAHPSWSTCTGCAALLCCAAPSS